jgi:hypothetical protein
MRMSRDSQTTVAQRANANATFRLCGIVTAINATGRQSQGLCFCVLEDVLIDISLYEYYTTVL